MDRRVLVVPAVAVFAACSPYGGGAFACTDSSQCGAGACVAGYCAFGDPSCASGQRYGALSGPMSNECVGGAPGDASGADAPPATDGNPHDAAEFCYGTGLATACFAAAPSSPVSLQGVIATDTSSLCASNVIGNPPWCVIAGDTIMIGTTVVATGSKPLVLVAVQTITVSAVLSVASTRTGTEVIGASADYAMCDPGTLPKAGQVGGGAGGSFGANGGDGGDGTSKTGGTHGASQTPSALRGGCPGQDGDGNGGAPGHGGGAIALIADGSITVSGLINASGEAGAGGQHPTAGGGGGGAGGLIVLDSPSVMLSGEIFTNGGGGGEASSSNTDGVDGNDPTVDGADGTNGNTSGGQGGAGGVGKTAAQDGQTPGGGHAGGGGGGSVGVIELYRATSIDSSGGTISPAPITH